MTYDIRKDIGQAFTLHGNYVHVDLDKLAQYNTDEFRELITKDEAINLFNSISEANGAKPLLDPRGYFKPLENNIYDYIKDAYRDEFEEQLDNIEQGYSYGTTYALEAILDKLDSKVAKDIRRFVPENMKYNELRFVEATDEVCDLVDAFAKTRVQYTQSYSIRRSVDKSRLDALLDRLQNLGHELTNAIGESMTLSDEELAQEYEQNNSLSMDDLQDLNEYEELNA